MREYLLQEIENLLKGSSLKRLTCFAKQLSYKYRNSGKTSTRFSQEELYAYLITRMPATYSVLCYVFQEVKKNLPSIVFDSILDLGSGPSTTLWAAENFFSEVKKLHLVERESLFISVAKQLSEKLALYPYCEWICADMQQADFFDAYDLIVASYSLGELEENVRMAMVEKIWKKTKKTCVIVEPGTTKGFNGLHSMRKQFLSLGAYIVAPCPHNLRCPMENKDWCHFYVRLPRSSFHQKMKEACLNYEDEKFSYLILSKNPISHGLPRILRHPFKGKGHIKLKLCTQEGIEEIIITKKEKKKYQALKKHDWGDSVSVSMDF